MKKIYVLLFCLCTTLGIAQINTNNNQPVSVSQQCLTDQRHHYLYQNDAGYRQRYDDNHLVIQNIINSGVRTGGVYTIPVVVHVIHLGESVGVGTNISDAQIQSAIDNLTDAYRNVGYSGLDIEIEFQLAVRDPFCNSTTGINRINGSGVTAGGDNYSTVGITSNNETTIKALSKWSNTEYYNIWIVSEIDNNGGGSGTQGYAYFPGASSTYDGAVILYNAFGYDPTGAFGYELKSYTNYNSTAIHELGHGLNLYHTFEGDDADDDGTADQCPTNTSCTTQGDLCCDTDPHQRDDSDCSGTIANTCAGVSSSTVYNNFMAYSSDLCQNRFTSDQKTRMRAALEGTRASLLTSLGATALSGTEPTATLSCTPQTTDLANSFALGIFEFTLGPLYSASGGSVTDGGYTEKWCTNGSLTTNTSYSVEVVNRVGGNNEDVKVYIDYNNDGDFADTGEEVFSSNGATTHSGSFTVPGTATTGTPLWVRVISDFVNNTISSSCYTPQYGQVEDYSVTISASTPAPVAAFSANSTSTCISSSVIFTDASTNATSWSWNFGSGASPSTATGVGPHTVTYSTSGTKTVTLDVTGVSGSDNETKTNYITINSTVTPAVSIAASANPITSGTSVTFTATPTNGGTTPTYQWKLNGGNVGTSSTTYINSSLANGDEISCVMTSNASCPSSSTATSGTITMTVTSNPAPVAAFSANSTSVCANASVIFTDASTNTTSWSWNFGSGASPATATGVGPHTVTYSTSGTKTVTLDATGAGGSDNETKTNYITVSANVTPSVSIVASANPITSGTSVTFTATPTNGGTTPTYQWKLNGGNVGTSSTTYVNSSLFNGDEVSCVMTSNASCTSSSTATSGTITMTVTSGSCSVTSNTGPGGVGTSTDNKLWLDASSLTASNGTAISSWTDRSGNNNNATQGTSAYRPLYSTNQLNGRAVVDFDGSNDFLNTSAISSLNTDNLTWFIVCKSDVTNSIGHAVSSNYSSGASTGSSTLWKTFMSSGGSYVSFVRSSTGSIPGTISHGYSAGYHFITNVWDGDSDQNSGYMDGTLSGTQTGVTANPSGHKWVRIGGASAGDFQYFNGKVAEVIVFSKTLNNAERIIVDNYLSIKYGITMNSDNIYAYQSTHSYDAAGIGQASNGSNHTSARGDIVEMNTPSSLANSDFIMWAHNNGSTTSSNTDVPTAYGSTGERMTRVWRADKTNDVGTVTVTFHLDGLASGTNFELLVDSDGTFTNATRITSGFTYDSNCNTATWTGVNFTDGDYFTIGTPDGSSLLQIPMFAASQTIGGNDEQNGFVAMMNEENPGFSFNIYPNPTDGIITIEHNADEGTVFIMNSMGQVVKTIQLNSQKETLDLNEFTSGIYFIQVIDRQKQVIHSTKVILK
jgi:PKD repeat protein